MCARHKHRRNSGRIAAQRSPVDVGRLGASPQFLYELACRGVEDSNEGPLWKHGAHKRQPLGQNIERNKNRNWDFERGSVGFVQNPDPPTRLGPLTFSDAVAIRVPWRFSAMQHSAPSWAGMSTGGFSVLARSTICTWPEWVPGKASRELLLLGHSTQRPGENKSTERPAVMGSKVPVRLLTKGILWPSRDSIPRSIKAAEAKLLLQRAEAGRYMSASLPTAGRTFGVVAGLKDVQLMGVVGEGEDFDHRVQDHHDPGRREETSTFITNNGGKISDSRADSDNQSITSTDWLYFRLSRCK